MSRIGRMPIAVPAGVTVEIAENNHVTVKGPKGTLERTLPSEMDIKLEGEEVVVTITPKMNKPHREIKVDFDLYTKSCGFSVASITLCREIFRFFSVLQPETLLRVAFVNFYAKYAESVSHSMSKHRHFLSSA